MRLCPAWTEMPFTVITVLSCYYESFDLPNGNDFSIIETVAELFLNCRRITVCICLD